ncbi:hypothetical protein IAU59_002050 [Kwoniella sp. CBS 9459]
MSPPSPSPLRTLANPLIASLTILATTNANADTVANDNKHNTTACYYLQHRMQLSLKQIILFIVFAVTASSAYRLLSDALQLSAMAHKNVIVQFKKTSSEADRQKIISDIKGKGGSVVSDDNVNSKIFPFITVSVPEADFSSLQSDFSGDHDVVENVEADQQVHTQ